MGKLENKVALVTGASSGMGHAIAKLFAKEGASVVVIARRKEKLDELIKKIESEDGKAVAVVGDVTNQGDVENAVKTTVDEFGKLDIVVNNAGLNDKMTPLTDMDDRLWDAVVDVNLNGPMRMFKRSLPEMLNNGGGAFVTIASVGGLNGARSGPAYTASKHGVIGLAKNVAYMYAKKDIRSNVIAPGGVKTEMADPKFLATHHEEGLQICAEGTCTAPRTAEPEEIAELALFLASDDASAINGATVTADCGWTAY